MQISAILIASLIAVANAAGDYGDVTAPTNTVAPTSTPCTSPVAPTKIVAPPPKPCDDEESGDYGKGGKDGGSTPPPPPPPSANTFVKLYNAASFKGDFQEVAGNTKDCFNIKKMSVRSIQFLAKLKGEPLSNKAANDMSIEFFPEADCKSSSGDKSSMFAVRGNNEAVCSGRDCKNVLTMSIKFVSMKEDKEGTQESASTNGASSVAPVMFTSVLAALAYFL
jgi:hypothetical protein